MRAPSIYFTATEPSADLLGADVMDALLRRRPEINLRSVGGPHMAARSETADINLQPLNVVGFLEGIKIYTKVRQLARQVADDIVEHKPDAVVLVDAWGFSIRVARAVHRRDKSIRIIKLLGPQVWATRPGRAKTLARYTDHLLCLHEFEAPYYEGQGLDITVVGNPALNRSQQGNAKQFRKHYNAEEDQEILLILPGSRSAEIETVSPPMIEAGRLLSKEFPELKIVMAPGPSVAGAFRKKYPDLPSDWLVLEGNHERYDAMAAATLALSCSGTVNTELAVAGTPFVTGYQTSAVTWFLLKNFLLKARFITLLNMAAGREIAPEFLQGEFNAQTLSSEIRTLLQNSQKLNAQIADQNDALQKMGIDQPPAAELSAQAILDDLAR